MARIKNATFKGSPIPDVSRDASIFTRTIRNAAGDFALVFDKITGENGHSGTDTINHSGSGRGSPLRMPIANQFIERSLAIKGTNSVGEYIVFAAPAYMPTGGSTKHRIVIEFDSTYPDEPWTVEVRSSTWALLSGANSMTRGTSRTTARDIVWGDVDLVADAWVYVVVRRNLGVYDTWIYSWSLFTPNNSFAINHGTQYPVPASVSTGHPSKSSLLSAGAAADAIDSIQIADDYPLDAYVLSRLNRMINATTEYLTGAKIPGNSSIICATPRNHNRANLTAEPLLKFPIFSMVFSAVPTDQENGLSKDWLATLGTSDPTEGPTDFVRYPQVEYNGLANAKILSNTRIALPSFATGAGSTLQAKILIHGYRYNSGATNAGLVQWRFGVSTAAGDSTFVAPAQLGTSAQYEATISAIPFTADTLQSVTLKCYFSGSVTTPIANANKFILMSWALCYV